MIAFFLSSVCKIVITGDGSCDSRVYVNYSFCDSQVLKQNDELKLK